MFRPTTLAMCLIAFTAIPSLAAGGSFSGASGHKVAGSVSVTQKGGKLIIQLGSSFRLDNAPDAYVTLGNSSRPVKGGTAGKLRKHSGAGAYSVRATPAAKAARQVVIWCRKYGVPLGVATLK